MAIGAAEYSSGVVTVYVQFVRLFGLSVLLSFCLSLLCAFFVCSQHLVYIVLADLALHGRLWPKLGQQVRIQQDKALFPVLNILGVLREAEGP